MQTRKRSISLYIGLLGIAIAAVVAYGLGLSGPWIFDDIPNIQANALLEFDAASLDGWRLAALSSDAGVLHRPVSMLTFAVNSQLSGLESAYYYKLANVLIHLLNGGLVFALAMQLAKQVRGDSTDDFRYLFALVACGVWTLHPLHVSTVLYPVQRMAQLSTFFVLVGLNLYAQYRGRCSQFGVSVSFVISGLVWLLLCAVLAVLSKENGVLLLWLVVVLEVTIYRGAWRGSIRTPLVYLGWLALIVPVIAAVLAYSFNPDFILAGYANRPYTLEERAFTQFRVLIYYVFWFLMPNIRSYGLFHDDISISTGLLSPITTILCLIAISAAILLGLKFKDRFPLLLFAVLFFLVGHSIESSVLSLELVFEHRNYLPSVGISLLLAYVIVQALGKLGGSEALLVMAFLFVVFVSQLALRAYYWGDDTRLATSMYARHPASARSHTMFANDLLRRAKEVREEAGNHEKEQVLLVSARHEFELIHQEHPDNLVSLVMLYQIDASRFDRLGKEGDWLRKIADLIPTYKFQPSDFYAVQSFAECVASRRCSDTDGAASELAFRIFDLLGVGGARIKYSYIDASGATLTEKLQYLKMVLGRYPDSLWFYYRLMSVQASLGLVGEAYITLGEIMQRDPLWRFTGVELEFKN